MTNIDFAIGRGNPAAVAIRFHVAQHGILSHMNFEVGSGLAALTQIGNEVQDLHIRGGRFGILTENTSPLLALHRRSTRSSRASVTPPFASTWSASPSSAARSAMCPSAIEIARAYSDQLWVKDSRFENVSGAAVIISNEKNAMTQVGFANVTCAGVPVFARFRESGKTVAGRGADISRRQLQPRPGRPARRLRRDRNALRRRAAGGAAGAAGAGHPAASGDRATG